MWTYTYSMVTGMVCLGLWKRPVWRGKSWDRFWTQTKWEDFTDWQVANSRHNYGATKVKERLPKDFKLRFGIIKSFSLEDQSRVRDVWYMQRKADTEDGSVLSKRRCAKVAILYSQRNFTGSQCSSFNSGVMQSRLRFFRTSRGLSRMCIIN